MKLAEISPTFKRDDNLCKENYRSINLLAIVSKLFENILSDQITGYFRNLLCSPLSAYRKGYSCQHLILHLTEYWCQALDNGSTVSTVAMDLSKAFDKMPHALLIAKLSAYGMSKDACNLIIRYLRNRRHRIKIMGICSDWATINRRVPQGSVLGPLLFNIFFNDLFYVKMSCEITKNADDNHLYYENQCHNTLKGVSENDVNSALPGLKAITCAQTPISSRVSSWTEMECSPWNALHLCKGLCNCIKLIYKSIRGYFG